MFILAIYSLKKYNKSYENHYCFIEQEKGLVGQWHCTHEVLELSPCSVKKSNQIIRLYTEMEGRHTEKAWGDTVSSILQFCPGLALLSSYDL